MPNLYCDSTRLKPKALLHLMLKNLNRYQKIAVIGFILNLLAQVIAAFAVDPYFANVLTPFFPIWIILFVVGWRKKHPRR